MLKFLCEYSPFIILLSGVFLFLYFLLSILRRFEKNREKRVELMRRAQKISERLDSVQSI